MIFEISSVETYEFNYTQYTLKQGKIMSNFKFFITLKNHRKFVLILPDFAISEIILLHKRLIKWQNLQNAYKIQTLLLDMKL